MSDQVQVSPRQLSGHSKQVAGISDRIHAVAEAARSATQSADLAMAFGIQAQPIGIMLRTLIQEPAAEQIGQISAALQTAADRLATCADQFSAVDETAAYRIGNQKDGLT
ncbi:hypothetical protein IU433_06530 [Nocardia puris]|uniref:Excreted virulence factor EspC (Type VII ESX diderm) n=1 Tax=Nocardia puris TaxID=208602 RepID=A0A366DCP6_9NOCA|nr:type VII secretion target [Nocardia puris]MBF6211190.1 hypothetical protein [Nocardia puris]MBF6364909.1 hypothetical protein [Nocardia puris]MBF6458695.1 hypothetical protein [Nocardia puris]RBO87806.1 excreted virulence factor EspC (type VII ESX diderm) [Nocardia puris]